IINGVNMTGRERLLTVLNGKRADKVPVTLFIQGQGHFITQINPETDQWDFIAIQKNVIDYQKILGVDVHARMLFFNPHKPVFAHLGHMNVDVETENWKVKTTEAQNGDTKLYKHEITTPEGILNQTFSINELRPGTFMYACTEKPINNMDDLRIAMKYEPPLSEEVREEMKKNVQKVKAEVGESGILSAWTNGGLFNNISGFIEHTMVYSVFLTDPDFYKEMMAFAKTRVFDFTQAVIDSGVDALCVGGNVAGGFLGEKFFDEYIREYETGYIDFIQSQGKPVIYHNCGEAMALVEPYKKMGIKNIEPFSPYPLGDGDLDALAGMVSDEFTVTGGVDQVNVIQKGTVEDVERLTLETLNKGKKFDRYILQSADFLEYGTPIENVEAFARIGLANAEY
ncbi:MAG: uroporphyrinogen decarboxylase family protein, partial [Spirochaetales bacterium]|nr:uroporphyrinogen decarboxylase family protein [Spirochaetales bacterium]